MTWAIAMPGFPTGGVLLADVRVSFVDPASGRVVDEFDGIQKVRVAPNLAMAFAGSVEAGFLLANDLTMAVRTRRRPRLVASSRSYGMERQAQGHLAASAPRDHKRKM